MKYKRLTTLLGIVSVVVVALAWSACGGDFGENQIGQLAIDGDIERELIPPPDGNRSEPQKEIRLENTGNGDLEVSKLELVNTPDRLRALQPSDDTSCSHESGSGADFDVAGNCEGDNQLCYRETTECRSLEMHETPLTIPSDESLDVGLVVLPSDETGFECDPDAAPEGAPSNYCGHLEIETDATNESTGVEDGNARVYFTATPKSGEIQVDPTSLAFAGIEGGETASANLEVSNPHADEALTILDVSFTDNASEFDFSGLDRDDEIPAGDSSDVQVDFTAPDDWGEETDEDQTLNTVLQIESTARNEASTNVSVNASNSYDLPALTADPGVLRFDDESEQTITLTNEGTARLVLRSISLDPPGTSQDYEFTLIDDGDEEAFEGTNVPGGSHVLRPDESVDVGAEFVGSDGGVASLDFNYSYDFNGENRTGNANALLLGDSGDGPIGMARPYTFTFSTGEDDVQQRSFAVRNVGNQDLDISDYQFEAIGCNPGEQDCDVVEYSAVDGPDTVEPNGLEEVTFEFDPSEASSDRDRVDMTVDSNSEGPLDQMLLSLINSDDAPLDVEASISAGFGGDTTAVGEEALFNADQGGSVDEDILEGAEWILLDRPDSSEVFVHGQGGQIGFVPDVAGTYKLGLILSDGDASSADTYEFEATD